MTIFKITQTQLSTIPLNLTSENLDEFCFYRTLLAAFYIPARVKASGR